MKKPTFGESKFIPDGLQENFGVELPDSFWDALGVKIQVFRTQRGNSSFLPEYNLILVGETWGQYPRTLLLDQLAILHELGHAFHKITGIITEDFVAKEVVFFFEDVSNLLSEAPSEVMRYFERAGQFRVISALLEKPTYQRYGKGDVFRLYMSAVTALAAASNGTLGWGHPPGYFAQPNQACMELFAVATEVYFSENPIFEEIFPALYFTLKQAAANFYEPRR